MKQYKIEKVNRIDKEIASLDNDLSREAIQRMIKEGLILVNGKEVKSSYKTNIGDIITIEDIKPKETGLKAQDIPIDIVYEDGDILIVNKRKGMVVHPGHGNPDGTLVNAVIAHCMGNLSTVGGKTRLRNST
jgi:23S rRNA pseudouridine1911/1915/1917 synthase